MFKWGNADEIGFLLNVVYPDADPIAVRYTELRKMVLTLDGFEDDPAGSTESRLEAIQMAWLAYRKER